jgi:hypothetical protein
MTTTGETGGADMGFEPENELEHAMLLAASQESARPDFYLLLLDSELWALGELTDRIAIDTVENAGRTFHPVFTAEKRIGALVNEPRPHFSIPGRVLFASTRGASFVINPGSEIVKTMSPEEIAWMLDQPKPAAAANIVVAEPKVYPTRLIKALCVLFTSRARIKAAHLLYVAREGIDSEAHPLIGLVADGDVPRLADEIMQVGAEALPGTVVDVVWLNPDGPLDPLQEHMLGIAPFYKRTASLI